MNQNSERLVFLLLDEQSVGFFPDRFKLWVVSASFTFCPSLSRPRSSKVLKWAVYLSRFYYVVEHVAGEEIVFVDMLLR